VKNQRFYSLYDEKNKIKIKNQKSKIKNQKSKIKNQKKHSESSEED